MDAFERRQIVALQRAAAALDCYRGGDPLAQAVQHIALSYTLGPACIDHAMAELQGYRRTIGGTSVERTVILTGSPVMLTITAAPSATS